MAATFLRYTSWITLLDGLIGFGFHVRGIARKPGGWRMPIVNLVMGPPVFAPLLFGTSAYLGVIASYLQREEDHGLRGRTVNGERCRYARVDFRDDIRVGRFQKHSVRDHRCRAQYAPVRRPGTRITRTTSNMGCSGRPSC